MSTFTSLSENDCLKSLGFIHTNVRLLKKLSRLAKNFIINTMRGLLLATLCCAFPSPILPQRKRRNAVDVPDNQTNLSWFDRIYNVSGGMEPIVAEGFVIKHLDIAYGIRRNASPCQWNICLWPSSPDGFVYIPYSISSAFGTYDSNIITAALSDIEDATCIRFKPRASQTNYINFLDTKGCWSSLGRIGGAQTISLERSGCVWSEIVTHEVFHALGLHHEHVRYDRDEYVQVQWENIRTDAQSNFKVVDTYNKDLTAYDYNSIMHYSNTAFSINGVLPTLIAIPNHATQFGQQFFMSYMDILKINRLYKCRGTTQRTTTTKSPSTTTTTRTTTRTTTTTTKSRTTTTTTIIKVKPARSILNGCGGNLTGSEGIFASPNYPDIYPNNVYCHWNITANTQFRITFTDLDIEGTSNSCQFDKLKIYNGRDLNTLYQLRDICGQTLPSPITSYEHTMQIVFTSDSSMGRKGFRLVYQAV
ncbi:high choriolytic enzyme 1-like [Rhinoderma darwinii]|uniref:high choriolytic enzyme 1-like n=1 Tax=Rhinoderma darwinii TaxID=43563 RepID=UPI003F6765D4